MPGQILDAPAEHRFPSSTSSTSSTTSGYFTLTDDTADPRFDVTTQLLPPCSPGSSKGGDRTASPLNLARWAKRQNHTHHQDRHKEEHAHKLKKGNNRAEERKLGKVGSKQNGLARSGSIQRQAQAAVPQMTREEFEALPLAIQRKYFSTLERLRFAQDASLIEGISQHYDDISNFKRRNARRDRSPSEDVDSRSRRGSDAELDSSASDSPPLCAGLQEATCEEQEEGGDGKPCREDKARPTIRHRASVDLDAADEAGYKHNKPADGRNPSSTVDLLTPPLSPSRRSMGSQDGFGKEIDQSADGRVPQSFFESFRWLDEEEDLDLRLFLDDYHANLREGTPMTKQRPTFRRRISVSKVPFGRRSSVSSAEAVAPKSSAVQGSGSDGPSHPRRKSRTLSFITPKHASPPPVAAIDPSAAHYQDPEARLKLRVYLASPQKFDEAVEFGFPATDVLSPASPLNEDGAGLSRQPKQRAAGAPPGKHTFLADQDEDEDNVDSVSLESDHASVADPESPKTPEPFEHRTPGPHHARFASATLLSGRGAGRKTPEGACYAQVPATSREMTLRMTLTRPDLRSHEDEIYGWQQQKHTYQQHSRRPTALASLAAENRIGHNGNGGYGTLERFPEVDHWNGTTTEKGVIRRIWDRVRRG
ncbi:hypothetical protein VTH06DRAFT_2656 [Thermothelomyces fergusii]